MLNKKQNHQLTIITEGGKKFGFGHITRTISISTAFKKYNFKTNFVVNVDTTVTEILKNEDFFLFDWLNDFQTLKNLLKTTTLILLDSILISDIYIKKLELLNIPIIFIDDDKRKNILDKGFIVDWTVLSDKQNYFMPRKKSITYFLGSKYTPLRSEFKNIFKNKINKNIKNIMVTFGGSDVRNLTPKILNFLVTHYPNTKKNIIVGNGFSNIDAIKQYKDINTTLIFNANATMMKQTMQNSDLAIAAGGQTLYELALVGVPSIAILLVNNAIDDTEGWAKVGFLINIGWWNNENLITNLDKAILKIQNQTTRVIMQKSTKEHISSDGASLLVKKIEEKYHDTF